MNEEHLLGHIHIFVQGAYFMFLLVSFVYFAFVREQRRLYHSLYALTLFLGVISMIAETHVTLEFWGLAPLFWRTILMLLVLPCVPTITCMIISLLFDVRSEKRIYQFLIASEAPFILLLVVYLFWQPTWYQYIAIAVAWIYCIITWLQIIRRIMKYNKMLYNSYANVEDKGIKWLQGLLITAPIFLLLYIIIGVGWFREQLVVTNIIYYCAAMVFFSYIDYNIEKQKPVDMQMLLVTDEAKENDKRDIIEETEKSIERFGATLQKVFVEQEMFTRQNITVKDLATATQTNISFVSSYLNNVLKKNYNQYVNELRIRKACKLMCNEKLSIEEIGKQVGFVNTATFWRSFQVITGMTPGQYRELQHRKEEVEQRLSPIAEVLDDEQAAPKTEAADEATSPIEAQENKQDIEYDFYTLFMKNNVGFSQALTQKAPDLTPRELQLCILIAAGKSNDEVCGILEVSPQSLRVFRSRIRAKMNLERKQSLDVVLKGMSNE